MIKVCGLHHLSYEGIQCPLCTNWHTTIQLEALEMERKAKARSEVAAMEASVSATGGLRYNKGKAKLSLVPASLENAVAEVIYKSSAICGGKYPLHNWRKGMSWSEVGESLMRHAKAFVQKGLDTDSESGLPHLYHIATNVAFLIEYMETHPEMDDRYKGPNKEKK